MNVQLTTFSKRRNSTKTPATFDTTRDCTLKEGCSILTPLLRFARSTMDHEYNYVYIPDFDRYYYVRDVIYDGALIYYDCVVDALASWKTGIGSSDQYVLRSASQWDGNVVDNLYPTKAEVSYQNTSIANPYSFSTESGGFFSVGIVGSNGGTMYYLFDPSTFKTFLDYILSDAYAQQVLGVLAVSAMPQLKLAIDALEYITSIVWIPITDLSANVTAVSSVKVGVVDVSPINAYLITQNVKTVTFQFNNIIAHPLAATRGNYLNMAPYRTVDLFIPPYGKINIDTVSLLESDALSCVQNIDIRTGTTTCNIVLNDSNATGKIVSTLTGCLGIPQQISQVRQLNGLGAATVYAQAAATSALNALKTDTAHSILGGIQAIGSAAASMIPSPSVIGGTGGFDSLAGNITLMFQFLTPVDDDVTQRGRPLCKQVTINTLSGYVLCSNAEIELPATDTEIAEIINYLNGGFFYE